MIPAKISTAKIVIIGPVLDADGVAVVGGVVGDFKLSKNGAAPGALDGSATLTHRHTGFYSLALTANDLDTVGTAQITIDDTVNSCAMINLVVMPATTYDALYTNSAGAANGLLIAGSNAATTFAGLTTGALACTTITSSGAVAFQTTFAVTTSTSLAALTCTGITVTSGVNFQSTFTVSDTVNFSAGLSITQSHANQSALVVTGNGSGPAAIFTGGNTSITTVEIQGGGTNSDAIYLNGSGTGAGLRLIGGATGNGVKITTTAGDAILLSPTAGHGINIAANGTSKHGIFITGGTAGTSDALKLVAGSGGVGLRCDTATFSGAVTLSSTLTVSGATSFAAVGMTTLTASGAVAFQSTFAVTTSTSLAALSATTVTFSGAVAFQSTFAVTTSTSLAALSCTTLTASGAVAFQSTFGVTGTTTLAAVNTGAIGTGNVTVTGTLGVTSTVTLNALTVTNATTLSGAVSLGSTLGVTGAITATNASNNVTLGTFTVTTNAIAWNAAWDAEVQSEVDDALVTRFLDKLVTVSGTSDSGTTTTMVDAARTEADADYWKGQVILFTSGNISGQAAIITDFNAGTDTFTFRPATTQVVATQTYVILPNVSVWDDLTAEHLGTGSTGASLNAAGSAGDPWLTALPGGYAPGQAGFILGTYLDAAITSRMATYTQPTGFLAATFPSGTIANTTNITAGTITTVTTTTNLTNAPPDSAGVTTLLARVGAFTGTTVNTVLGFFKALLSKTATTPSDVGGTFDPSTDSTEAIRDRGDAAWVTATSVTVSDKTGFKLASDGLALVTAWTVDITGNLSGSVGSVTNVNAIADALLNRDMSAVSDTNSRSPLNALRFLRNKWDVAGTTLTVCKENDSTTAWTSTVTVTPGADPITGSDP